jgi:catechol 2,3-dioxygenase-like lactoylglutathione lyase family enzyme
MTGDINIFHHVGLIASNMDALIARYEKLGFMFTPLSMPSIVLKPGGDPEPLGAGNRCAIFSNNYLEVLGVVDKPRWDSITKEQRGPFDIDPPLARYQGLHVLHFGADDIELVRARCEKQGIPCSDVRLFQRPVDTTTGPQTMKAKYMFFPQGGNLPSLTQVAQHLTPELVLQPRYMKHRNGAKSVSEAIICVVDPDDVARQYARYAGREVARKHDLRIVDLGHSRIVVVSPGHLGAVIPGAAPPTLPFLAGFTVATESVDNARKILGEADVPFVEHGGRVIVAAEHAFGSAILFEPEGAGRL